MSLPHSDILNRTRDNDEYVRRVAYKVPGREGPHVKQSYDPSKKATKAPVLRNLQGATSSQRKEFRAKEKVSFLKIPYQDTTFATSM